MAGFDPALTGWFYPARDTEAALLDCRLLVTADGHLLDVPANPLKLLLDSFDVSSPIIVSPRKIVLDFFPKK